MRFREICALGLMLCGVARANIIPTGTTISGTGPFTWTYAFQLSQDQNADSGLPPAANPVPHNNVAFGSFLTIFDFAGYVTGTCSGPVGWTCMAQNTGFTPDDVSPFDNPGVVNLTWTYTSGPTLLGQPGGLALGLFSAVSTSNFPILVSYAARGVANAGSAVGTIADNVGQTQGPLSLGQDEVVPEPITLLSIGIGLAAICVVRRAKS